MNQGNLISIKENIKKLMESSAFMPQKLKDKIARKLTMSGISREKLEKIQLIIEKISQTEDIAIREVLVKDPLFFKNLKRQFSREKLEKKLAKESQLRTNEMSAIEKELHNLLTT